MDDDDNDNDDDDDDDDDNNSNNVLWVLLRQKRGLFSRTLRTYFCFVVTSMT